jgi:hypothetical protein
MEKDAAGCPSLPSHYGLTNPGISRYLASRLPYEEETRTQKPFIGTQRVPNPAWQSRASSQKRVLRGWWGDPPCEA